MKNKINTKKNFGCLGSGGCSPGSTNSGQVFVVVL